jgi:hypothetical protein
MSSVNNNNPKPLLRLGALCHNDIKTTMRYTHMCGRSLEKIISALDDLNL